MSIAHFCVYKENVFVGNNQVVHNNALKNIIKESFINNFLKMGRIFKLSSHFQCQQWQFHYYYYSRLEFDYCCKMLFVFENTL